MKNKNSRITLSNFARRQMNINGATPCSRERLTLNEVIAKLPKEQRTEILLLMHRMFVLGDCLEMSVLAFKEKLREYTKDNSISVLPCDAADRAIEEVRNLVRVVDAAKDTTVSDNFGSMCDRINGIVFNEILNYFVEMAEKNKNKEAV